MTRPGRRRRMTNDPPRSARGRRPLMALPVKTLPVVQNWDCPVTGTCCHEYRATLSEEEVARIRKQDWTLEELDGLPPFKFAGPPWARKTQLNHRESGACVFLGAEGRCRI